MMLGARTAAWSGKSTSYRYAVVAYGHYYNGMFPSPRTIGYLTNEDVQLGVYGSTVQVAYNSTLDTLEFVFTDADAKAAYGERQTVSVTRDGAGGKIACCWNNPDFYVDTHHNDHSIPSADPLMLSIGDFPAYDLCLLVKIEDTKVSMEKGTR